MKKNEELIYDIEAYKRNQQRKADKISKVCIADEVVYDDSYKIPIQKLLERHDPKNIDQLRLILDDNGYIGRHRTFKQRKLGISTGKHVVEVTVPNGDFMYKFYPKFAYHMDDGVLPSRKVEGFVHNEHMLSAMKVFAVNYFAGIYTLRQDLKMKLHDSREIIQSLYNLRLIEDDRLVFSDPNDVQEVYDNLIMTI